MGMDNFRCLLAMVRRVCTCAVAGNTLYICVMTGMAICSTLHTLIAYLEKAALGAAYTCLGTMLWSACSSVAQYASPLTTVLYYALEAKTTTNLPVAALLTSPPYGPDSSLIVASCGAVASAVGWIVKPSHSALWR